jgi:hypothetical protein
VSAQDAMLAPEQSSPAPFRATQSFFVVSQYAVLTHAWVSNEVVLQAPPTSWLFEHFFVVPSQKSPSSTQQSAARSGGGPLDVPVKDVVFPSFVPVQGVAPSVPRTTI